MATAQMRREFFLVAAEASHIDDALDARFLRRLAKVSGSLPVGLFERTG